VPDVILVDVEATPVVAADDAAVPVVDVAAEPLADSPADVSLDVELAELVDGDSEDVPVVSAVAQLGEETTITPIPRAAASAPTRPT
jgi:hypothetical protein